MPDSVGTKKYNGKLHKHWSNMQNSGTTIIRFGGIAPDENKPSNYQYIKMIDSARTHGIEPIIQVPFNNYQYTAQQAADIVRYINITKGKNIKYWIIANEPNLGYSYTSASQVAAYFKPFASAMKAVDPAILIIGPETAGFHNSIITGLTTPGGTSDITGKDAAGRYYVDIISFHNYPMGNGTSSTRAKLISKLTETNMLQDNLTYLNSRITSCNTYHNRTGAAALKTAITEANVNYLNPVNDDINGVGSNSFIGGQFYAELMGISLKKGVSFVNLWSSIEGNSSTTNKGYIDNVNLNKKPLYYHFKLMADNFKGNVATCTDNQTNVKTFACKDAQQTTVIIMNQDAVTNFNYAIRLNTASIAGSNSLKINIDAGLAVEYNYVIPNQSTVLLTYNSSGVLIRKYEYSLAIHATANIPPTRTDYIATASSYSPLDNSVNVTKNSNLVLTFSEPILKGVGNIIIKEGGVVKQTIPVSGSNVVTAGSIVTINPAVDFTPGLQVNIEIALGVFKGLSNNNYWGIADATTWNFTVAPAAPVDITAPTVSSYTPADNATNILKNSNLVLTFNEPVLKGSGNITVKEGGLIKQTISVTSSNVTVAGNTVTINSADFINGALVNIEMPLGIFKDTANNNYAGIANASAWNFAVVTPPDTTAPTVGAYYVADNSVGVVKNSNLVLTFSEPLLKGTGNITIKEGGIVNQTIPVSGVAVTVTGNIVTINPSDFTYGAVVNIEMPSGIFKDTANNTYDGITSATTWNFTVIMPPDTTAPTIISYLVVDDAINVLKNSNLTITFSEPIQKGNGDIIVKEGGVVKQVIPVSGTNVSVAGNVVTN